MEDDLRTFRLVVASIVTVVWATTYLAAVLYPDKIHAPAELSAPMLAVVTWALGAETLRTFRIVRRNGNDA